MKKHTYTGELWRTIAKMRELEKDHEPEGWPAVQMKDISMLCHYIENAIPSVDLLQTRIEKGQRLKKQDGEWWLFDVDRKGVVRGKSIRDILLNLIWLDC